MNCLAPIVLFTYKRLDTLKQTISALQENYLADKSDLHIFSDGAKKVEDAETILLVRNYLKSITGFNKIFIYESPINKGLATSIKEGVTKLVNDYKKIIVLEDDLITAYNFLTYMNKALDFYQHEHRVFNISGFAFNIQIPENYDYDVYVNMRGCSWGWATWLNRWQSIDWNIINNKFSSLPSFFSVTKIGTDMPLHIMKYKKNLIDSWAIPWNCYQFYNKYFTVYPVCSKVVNVGFGDKATHTVSADKRFITQLDTSGKLEFKFLYPPAEDKTINKNFLKNLSYTNKFLNKINNKF